MGKNKNEIVVAKDEGQVDGFITQAIEKNLPVETMEKLFTLRKEVKAEYAREEFVKSLAKFQSECPTIVKTKKVLNKGGDVRYQYAPLESIINQIAKSLIENGLSYSWDVDQENDKIKVTAKITHELGHSETSSFEVPKDTSEYMTSPQRYASALTFAKRYSLCNALGIATADEDTDATDVKKEANAKSPKAQMLLLLKRLGLKIKDSKIIEQQIKTLTNLEPVEANYEKIVVILEEKVKENEEYEGTDIR